MKIRSATLTPFRIPLRRPLVTAHERHEHRDGLLVRIESEDGNAGHGESMPLAGFGLESLETSERAIVEALTALLSQSDLDLDAALAQIARDTEGVRSARAALDVALHDLFARAEHRSVASLLCGAGERSPHSSVRVSSLIASEDDAGIARHGRQAFSRGFRTLKLKVGVGDVESDVRRVAALRAAVGPKALLRLDANGAWDEDTALGALERLAVHEIEFIEQPTPADDIDALARIRATSPIPIAADESACDERAAISVIDRKAADLIILKPAAVGGLRPAQRIAEHAHAAGVDVIVTGMLDSALGTAAALHLAASLPGPPRAAGLATDALLESDLVLLPRIGNGERALPEGPGLGVSPRTKNVEKLATGPTREIGA